MLKAIALSLQFAEILGPLEVLQLGLESRRAAVACPDEVKVHVFWKDVFADAFGIRATGGCPDGQPEACGHGLEECIQAGAFVQGVWSRREIGLALQRCIGSMDERFVQIQDQ
ncbi:hypothetical protein D3C81_1346960 [compost metagenome]